MSKPAGPVSYVKLPPMPGAGTVVWVLEYEYDTRYRSQPDVRFWSLVCSA